MPSFVPTKRIAEAERLIDLARALLDRPEAEIVVNYLDHAVEALQIVSEREAEQVKLHLDAQVATEPAMAPAVDHG